MLMGSYMAFGVKSDIQFHQQNYAQFYMCIHNEKLCLTFYGSTYKSTSTKAAHKMLVKLTHGMES